MVAVLSAAIGYADMVSAHSQPGAIGRKNSKAGGTDVYQVTCFDDGTGAPDHLFLHVRDLLPRNPALISVQATLATTGETTALSTDWGRDGDASFSVPDLILAGGASGIYNVSVNKTRSKIIGREIYLVEFHCQTALGEHTGTNDPVMLQNQ